MSSITKQKLILYFEQVEMNTDSVDKPIIQFVLDTTRQHNFYDFMWFLEIIPQNRLNINNTAIVYNVILYEKL